MGHRHDKTEILAGALEVALSASLSELTFARVGERLGISDRTVVYYFPTKDDLIREVLMAMGIELQTALAAAFKSPADDHVELVRAAWGVLAQPDVDPLFALFFEANGLAVAGREPYKTVVPLLVETWITWSAQFLKGTTAQRRAHAEAAIAMVDGLLLLRQLAGPAAANRAARRFGVR